MKALKRREIVPGRFGGSESPDQAARLQPGTGRSAYSIHAGHLRENHAALTGVEHLSALRTGGAVKPIKPLVPSSPSPGWCRVTPQN